ncbi:response regulator transcription factor [Arenibaculum pallidiluteum]|uniref:response regulator transcription factor n=1 Tax=Arenibaculum pallidiluteum TaxID=2812559 RepID=UPI002E2CA448|nr:response regulator transcription factor [Arenibaculum pallidiluteum]
MVDDHVLVRRGLALSIEEAHPRVQVIEAASLAQAVDVARRRPDLAMALCDLRLPDADGIDAVTGLVAALGDVPVVVVSAQEDPVMMAACIRAGARGFLPKAGPAEVMTHALSLVLEGRGEGRDRYVPMPAQALSCRREASEGAALLDRLTDRQRDVFRLLLEGQSNKEIARSLGVLEGTVKVHVRAIMQKLGVSSRTQVAIAAARAGCLNV